MAEGSAPPSPPPPPSTSIVQSRLSFTEGFLLGQISIVILLGVFIKFFIFGDPPSPETIAAKRALAYNQSNRILNNRHHRSSPSISIDSPSSSPLKKVRNKRSTSPSSSGLTTATILAKTYYNVDSHQPESLDWFNVLIAQTIAQFRNDAHHDDAILTSLTNILNGPQKPDFLSDIKVTEIGLGEDFPILSNCRVHPVDDDENGQGGRLQARMDVDLSDFITLGVETKIILNYPKPLTAVLPVALAVSVIRFSGTLSISFVPSSSSSSNRNNNSTSSSTPTTKPGSRTPTTLAFCFLPDYRLDLSVRSLVGSRLRLQDIPKIAQLVESRLHAWIDERCVEPRVQQVVLPSLWPKKKNTRGPMGEGGDEGSGDGGGGVGGGDGVGGVGGGNGVGGGDGVGDVSIDESWEEGRGNMGNNNNNNKTEGQTENETKNNNLRWRGHGQGGEDGRGGTQGVGGGGAGGGGYDMPGGMPGLNMNMGMGMGLGTGMSMSMNMSGFSR